MKKISINELRDIKEEGVAVILSGLVLNLVTFVMTQTISLLLSFGGYCVYLADGFSVKSLALLFQVMYIAANASKIESYYSDTCGQPAD
jgi:hypothetical protein